jgi:transcriptional regulator with XRE-family HTH domain
MDNRNTNPDRLTFGELINKLRLDRNLTKYDLASAIGVIQSEIDDWEKGTSVPGQDRLTKLEQKLMIGKIEMDVLREAVQQFENSPKKLPEISEPILVVTDEGKSLTSSDKPGEFSGDAQTESPDKEGQPAEIPKGPPPPRVLYKQQIYVEASTLRALDDLREEHGKWRGYCAICLGAVLTAIINLVTGGVLKSVTWAVLVPCIVVALITGITALQKKRKAEDAKRKLFEEGK